MVYSMIKYSYSVADLIFEVMNALTMLAGQDLANQVYIIEPDLIRLHS